MVEGHLPFPALVGIEPAQQALILLAVEPRLRGVILAAPVGTGKSSLARGMRALLGDEATPFVEIPPGIDTENLLGGLDIEATMRTGSVVLQKGVLARAHGGVAYVDGVNLLTDGSANLLLSVIDEGEVRIEREGISLRSAAHFSLIGSYDPAEGQPRRHLIDRVGLIVTLPGAVDAQQRAAVIRHNLFGGGRDWGDDLDFLRGMILGAREHLPSVQIGDDYIRHLSTVALMYGVEGHRVDLFAVRAACASAALAMRDEVEDEDFEMAVRLVILPRATRIPTPPPDDNPPEPPPPEPPQDETPPEQEDQPPDELPEQLMPPPEQILEALASQLPEVLEDMPFRVVRRGRTGSRGATEGKRGRHIRSIPGDPNRARLDVVATLRAAAPWQPLRAAARANRDGVQNGSDPHGRRHVLLEAGDIRVKQFRSKAGALFCFVVDASGSMALHRMRQAKGAVHTLLQKAYVNRDRVAMVAFRRDEAELLMPPTQSVELAKRALDLLPTGGGTPLASGLLLACDVAAGARRRGILQTVLVVLTDGRANIPLREGANLQTELQQLGKHIIDSHGLQVVVVDTKRSYLSRGEARQLAEWLGGEYAYLPNASGEQIGEYIAGAR
jgi:magnesium chelatase subunit D